jgi:hypothetical protein
VNAADYIATCIEFHQGKDKAITSDDLLTYLYRISDANRAQVPDERSLRDTIHSMRRAGCVIASCERGYYLPRDRTEALEYLDSTLRSRALDLLQTIRAQRRAIAKLYDGQLRMQL